MKIQMGVLGFSSLFAEIFLGASMTLHAETSVLTQNEAEIRAQLIEKVDYKLYFQLSEKDPNYNGRVEAILKVAENAHEISKQIFVDFAGGGYINSIHLNNRRIDFEYDNAKISIPTEKFYLGKENFLTIEFSHPYSSSGFGFHRTKDKADGQYYMYSDFEPYNASKAFPVLDQPDLKATYTLVVDAPPHWQVIANTQESKSMKWHKVWRRWVFPTTARFSTYLFALIAGPFQKWESTTDSGIPLRLFARGSMAQYLSKDVEHWFQVTREGFKFFEQAFQYPYPFGKYDQILTPDYNHGAMENVGAVTFTEKYIFRTPATPTQILRRAETITHELAHMWFGNLVTMKWWDDLWLNESFATYVSNLAMSKFSDKIGPADVWQEFSASNKEWAYREDDSVTTHPIVGKAEDTNEALANFDGITYGKGASVLKQLVHFIGEEAFLEGLKAYFQTFAFGNATRSDFIRALAKASHRDLAHWENEWLKSSGTNAVQIVVSENDGKISSLALQQFPDEADQKLRSHRTTVGLYDLNDQGAIVLRETIPVTYSGRETWVKEAIGKQAPRFIFPNVGDHDFVHVILDSQSLLTLETSLDKVSDPLLRQMLWSTLWNMVRHAKLPPQKFADMAIKNLAFEKDLAVLQKGLEYLVGTFWYLSPNLKPIYQEKSETFVWTLFQNATPESAMQISLFFRYIRIAKSSQANLTLKQWIELPEAAPGLPMDQERRWAVISRLAANGLNEIHPIIERERAKDKNDKGDISAMIAEVSFPAEANKRLWWNRILEKEKDFEKLSIEKARSLMSVFHDSDQPKLTEFMTESFFEILPTLGKNFPDEFNSSFASMMYPSECSEALDTKVEEFLKNNPNMHIGMRRELLKNRQFYQRTLKARLLSDQFALNP